MKNLFISITLFASFLSFSQEAEPYSKFAVKLSPTQLLFGEFHLAFEHKIAPHSSFEISAGPTISEIGGTFIITDNNVFGNGSAGRNSDIGYFFGIAYRYYPLSYAEAPRGLYISPEFKHRVYNIKYKDVSGYSSEVKVGSVVQTMFRFNIGYQFWPGKRFALDVFTGIGIGTTDQTQYFSTIYYNADGSYTGSFGSQKQTRASANATFGLKIGIGDNR